MGAWQGARICRVGECSDIFSCGVPAERSRLSADYLIRVWKNDRSEEIYWLSSASFL